MTHTLTKRERETIDKLRQQHAEALEMVERAKRVIDEKQREALAISGALQGAALLLASQNGLVKSDKDSIQFSDDFTTLTVTPAAE